MSFCRKPICKSRPLLLEPWCYNVFSIKLLVLLIGRHSSSVCMCVLGGGVCACSQELEKNMELSTGSFQRQLASERKKTHEALHEIQTLQQEMDKLSAKLKV